MNVPRNVNKAIDLLSRSSKNGQKQADFILGYIYQVENDASKSISHYKDASSFNDQYAKTTSESSIRMDSVNLAKILAFLLNISMKQFINIMICYQCII